MSAQLKQKAKNKNPPQQKSKNKKTKPQRRNQVPDKDSRSKPFGEYF